MIGLLAFQMISPLVIMVPLYRYMDRIGLTESHFGASMIYIAIAAPLFTWMLKGFLDGIPQSLEDAAMIDGCTRFGAFMRVVLPLSLPGLTSAFVLNAILGWSQFIIPFILLSRPNLLPISVGIFNFQGTYSTTSTQFLAAASVLSIVPAVVVFLAAPALHHWRPDGRGGERMIATLLPARKFASLDFRCCVHMIGNAHIDPVWLWPWQAGADEALATMSAAADRCDEYPEFIFTRGEAWLYQQVEKLHPELFKRIRKHVERGQWHITGGQFLQPDLNLPTEAGLHRQIAHGQRYFRDRFGIAPTIGYNVDSFGHTASLPDILVAHGYTGYVFRRPEQHQVPLPANTFVWRGVKGGEVIAFRISPGYVANFAELTGQVKIAIESADPAIGHTMCFYGVGNHGGGPSKAMIEWIIAHRHSFAGHELIFSTPQAFMDAIADKRDRLPRVSVELQHTFPGCYSVMHDIKSAQRHGEHLLDQAEHAAVAFASDEAERRSSLARIERAWDDLLFTEFHDILTGTSIPSAWGSVRAMQGRARIAAEEVLFEVTRRWSYRVLPRVNEHQIVAINTHDAPFRGFVEAEPYLDFDDWRGRWLSRRARKTRAVSGDPARSKPAHSENPVSGGDRRRWRPPVPGAERSASKEQAGAKRDHSLEETAFERHSRDLARRGRHFPDRVSRREPSRPRRHRAASST